MSMRNKSHLPQTDRRKYAREVGAVYAEAHSGSEDVGERHCGGIFVVKVSLVSNE